MTTDATRDPMEALVDELVMASRDAGYSWMEQHADSDDNERRQNRARAALLAAVRERADCGAPEAVEGCDCRRCLLAAHKRLYPALARVGALADEWERVAGGGGEWHRPIAEALIFQEHARALRAAIGPAAPATPEENADG